MIFQPDIIAHVVEPVGLGKTANSSPYMTYYIGAHRTPFVTHGNCSVFLSHYASTPEPFSGPVKRMTFLQLGSCESPNLLPFASTCTNVEFNGHISNVHAVFDVIKQFPKVNKVDIVIGPSQLYFQQESYEEFFKKTPSCPSVKKLKLTMDLDYFHSFQLPECGRTNFYYTTNDDCLSPQQFSLVSLAESIIKHAGDSFPNLKYLIVELPENDRLCAGVQSLIQACSALRSKTQTCVQNISHKKANRVAEIPFNDQNQQHQHHHHHHPPSWSRFSNSNDNENLWESQPVTHQKGGCVQPYNIGNFIPSPNAAFPSNENMLNDFKPMMTPSPINYRPPPGFPPLHTSKKNETEAAVSLDFSIDQLDVHQRVNSWLRTLGK